MLFKLTIISVLSLIHAAPVQRQQGRLKVTLSIFSGRRDPKWYVSSENSQYEGIVKLLDSAYKEKQYDKSPPARLGYKGFIVKRERKMVIVGPHTIALQMKLLETIPQGLIPKKNIDKVLDAINKSPAKSSSSKTSSKQGKRYAPPYNPAPWTASEYAEECNNCYNYANQLMTYTVAQPGVRYGEEFQICNAHQVQVAAMRDGLRRLEPQPGAGNPVPGDPGDRRLLVALVVDPDIPADPARGIGAYEGDFHWYLLDNDGRWSHKPGQTAVTRLDNDGNEIWDPRIANIAPYQFVSFMTSDPDEVRITDCESDDSSMNSNSS